MTMTNDQRDRASLPRMRDYLTASGVPASEIPAAALPADRGLIALHIGLDLGKQHDPSAVVVAAVCDRYVRADGTPAPAIFDPATRRPHRSADVETLYQIQTMERLDLGTDYLAVAARVVRYVAALWEWEKALRTAGELSGPRIPRHLYADATGVGQPVMDILRLALRHEPRADGTVLHPVTFTHGDRYVEQNASSGFASLGKAYLVSRLQALFQQRLCDLPAGHTEAEAMLRELKDYEIRVDENANDKYGAFKVGTHDDLVTALGLACIEDPAKYRIDSAPSLWP